MKVPDELLYTESHEWVRVEGDTARVVFESRIIEAFSQAVLGVRVSGCHGTNSRRRSRCAESVNLCHGSRLSGTA